jgi:hypothetical protein
MRRLKVVTVLIHCALLIGRVEALSLKAFPDLPGPHDRSPHPDPDEVSGYGAPPLPALNILPSHDAVVGDGNDLVGALAEIVRLAQIRRQIGRTDGDGAAEEPGDDAERVDRLVELVEADNSEDLLNIFADGNTLLNVLADVNSNHSPPGAELGRLRRLRRYHRRRNAIVGISLTAQEHQQLAMLGQFQALADDREGEAPSRDIDFDRFKESSGIDEQGNLISKTIRSDDVCAVCLEPFSKEGAERSQDDLVLLRCGHLFHTGCLQPWLAQRETCPTCRGKDEVLAIFKPVPPDAWQDEAATVTAERVSRLQRLRKVRCGKVLHFPSFCITKY